MAINDQLTLLENTKESIKQSIINKGVSVADTDPFASYSDKIDSIQTGGGGDLDFTTIGYSYTPAYITDGLAASQELYNKFDPTKSTWQEAFGISYEDWVNYNWTYFPKVTIPEGSAVLNDMLSLKDTDIEIFPNIKADIIADVNGMFINCHNLRSVRLDGTFLKYSSAYPIKFTGLTALHTVGGTMDIDGSSASAMFLGCSSLEDISEMILQGTPTNCSLMFMSCSSLKAVPTINTSAATNIHNMFANCFYMAGDITLDLSSILQQSSQYSSAGIYQAFNQCISLKSITLNNLPAVKLWFNQLFLYCESAESITINGDVSLVQNTTSMFNGCRSLKQIQPLAWNSVTLTQTMYSNCTSLTEVPDLSFPALNLTSTQMFYNCTSLEKAGTLNFPVAITLSEMFSNCTNLKEVVKIYTPLATTLNGLFAKCTNLTKVGEIDLSSVTSMQYMFGFNNNPNISYLLIKNLGKSNATSYMLHPYNGTMKWGIEDAGDPLTTGARQSLIDSLITYSYDRAAAGMSTCSLDLDDDTKALLTEEEIAQITAKGFTIA